jgi:hypothetical protein
MARNLYALSPFVRRRMTNAGKQWRSRRSTERFQMALKKSLTILMATGVVLLATAAQPASAQQSCTGLYNRMMASYQNSGPYSPQYTQLRNRYTARCGPARSAVIDAPVARSGGGCEELRMACLRKDQLGERGAGNCRQYREMCRP